MRTREQEAYYQYGVARGIVRERMETVFAFGDAMSKDIRELYHIDELIRAAWRKRAVYRAWLPQKERNCGNCLHWGESIGSRACFHCIPIATTNWEPIRGNDDDA